MAGGLMSLATVNNAQQALQQATTPQQTKAVEGMAQAAKAWAKECGDYEMFVAAAHVYIMARRKTTELCLPDILHGSVDGYGNHDVTLADFGFTKMQWNRRLKELEFEEVKINEYFDECIKNGWHPSLFGMLHYGKPHTTITHKDWCNVHLKCNCGAVK